VSARLSDGGPNTRRLELQEQAPQPPLFLTCKTASPLLTSKMPVQLPALRNRIKNMFSVLLLRSQHRLSFSSGLLSTC
jgi:hypothetical protein